MAKFNKFIPQNIAPKATKRIGVYNSNGVRVGSIPLGFLKQPQNNKLYSFCAISDVHISYNTASEDFQRALTYVENNDVDFTCVCGDLTSTGSDSELTQYKTIVNTYAKTKPVYAISGNHETALGIDIVSDNLKLYTGNPLYYSFAKGNDVFIMLGHFGGYKEGNGGWRTDEFVSRAELQWLYETLEENRNKRCFLFNHVYPYEDGVGDPARLYNGRYWSTIDGTIGQAYINLIKHYKNVTLFHGHSHTKFILQELDKKANYSSDVGYRSVHIPSLSVPRGMVNDTFTGIYAESEGYIVDVYDNYIILNGRDFIDNENDGNIIPLCTYKVDTTIVNVPAKTFTDSTGTITV